MGKPDYAELNYLVGKAMQGDKRAFAKLCEREAQTIIYSCTRIMGNVIDGEDASQEVFITMQKSLPSLRMPEAFNSWLQKLLVNVCAQMRRKNMNGSSVVPVEDLADLFSDEDSEVLPEEYLQKKEKGRELMRVINHLPGQIQACIFMHYFREMKIADIADALQISEGSVKGYLYVGREKIRKAIVTSDSAAHLNSASFLPMAALGDLFRQEMNELVTLHVVKHCLNTAGIKTTSIFGWLATPAAKNTLLTAACTVIAAMAAFGYSSFASTRPAGFALQDDVPQRFSGAPAGSDEDMATENGAATPDISSPGLTPSGPGRGNPDAGQTTSEYSDGSHTDAAQQQATGASEPGTQITPQPAVKSEAAAPALPPPAAARPQAVETEVSGALSVQDTPAAANAAQLFGDQYYATVEQDGRQLALTMVAGDGSFTFDNLAITESGAYTLRVRSVNNYGLAFSSGSSGGEAEIYLTPGQAYTLARPFLVEDREAPVVALLMLDADGRKTAADPAAIEIQMQDATKLAAAWAVQSNPGESIVLEGDSTQIDSKTLGALPKGLYTVRVQVTDALGNSTSESGTFYISK